MLIFIARLDAPPKKVADCVAIIEFVWYFVIENIRGTARHRTLRNDRHQAMWYLVVCHLSAVIDGGQVRAR